MNDNNKMTYYYSKKSSIINIYVLICNILYVILQINYSFQKNIPQN